jgi:hypothetical protein
MSAAVAELSAAVAELTFSQDASRNSRFAFVALDMIPMGANLLLGGKEST